MLRLNAAPFVGAYAALNRIEQMMDGLAPEKGLDAASRQLVSDRAKEMTEGLHQLDAKVTLRAVERLYWYLQNSHSLSEIKMAVHEVGTRLVDELSETYIMIVPGGRASLYDAGGEHFGSKVYEKFPKTIEDIAEAGKCLSLGLGTATVFHLMRVMEAGVRALGKRFRIVIRDPRNETWANIIRLVNVKIEALPTKTRTQIERKRQLATASANLNAVRIATRNEVMHPKETYTPDEAGVVFDTTALFMAHLAGLV